MNKCSSAIYLIQFYLIFLHLYPNIYDENAWDNDFGDQSGYLQHVRLFLLTNTAVLVLSQFLGIIFNFAPLEEEAKPMVVTSVVTYTSSIGLFLGPPSSGYGSSVDWGVREVKICH